MYGAHAIIIGGGSNSIYCTACAVGGGTNNYIYSGAFNNGCSVHATNKNNEYVLNPN